MSRADLIRYAAVFFAVFGAVEAVSAIYFALCRRPWAISAAFAAFCGFALVYIGVLWRTA